MGNNWGVGLAAILLLGVIFVACDATPNDDEERYVLTIGLILRNEGDPAVASAKTGFVNKNNGKVAVKFEDSRDDKDTQIQQIDTFLKEKVDVLVVSLAGADDEDNIDAIITKAKNADIPLVFFLTGSGDQTEFYDIETDENKIAALQGKIIADYWHSNTEGDRNNDNKMQYIMVHGSAGNPVADARKTETIAAIENAGIMVEKLRDIDGAWGLDETKKVEIEAFLQSPDGQTVEAIICGNDAMALGVIGVLEDIPYFTDKDIPVTGIDGINGAIEAVNSGKMLGTVSQDFEKLGEVTFDICYALGTGESIPDPGTGWIKNENHIVLPPKKIIKE
jgi:methyl-galactoside transport system substrate-binding protein